MSKYLHVLTHNSNYYTLGKCRLEKVFQTSTKHTSLMIVVKSPVKTISPQLPLAMSSQHWEWPKLSAAYRFPFTEVTWIKLSPLVWLSDSKEEHVHGWSAATKTWRNMAHAVGVSKMLTRRNTVIWKGPKEPISSRMSSKSLIFLNWMPLQTVNLKAIQNKIGPTIGVQYFLKTLDWEAFFDFLELSSFHLPVVNLGGVAFHEFNSFPRVSTLE